MIEAIIEGHLAEELRSGDPVRVRQAALAKQANEKHGIGGWCWGTDLSGLGPVQSRGGGKIIPLTRSKVA